MRFALPTLLIACSGGTTTGTQVDAPPGACSPLPELDAEEVATGLTRPIAIEQAPGDGRLFVAELMQVTDLVTSNEQGLLGLVFHPQHAQNGKLYVDYTDGSHQFSRIVEY